MMKITHEPNPISFLRNDPGKKYLDFFQVVHFQHFVTFMTFCVFATTSGTCFVSVVAIFWARVFCHLVVEEAGFRMRVTLGVIVIRSLVYTKHVPGRLGSGAVPEWPWISGLMRKSSSSASAPSMRFSVLLNSCDNFLVILPSISSETWVM